MISASSFCMRLADVPKALEIFGLGFGSLRVSSLVVAADEFAEDPTPPPPPPAAFVAPVPDAADGSEPGCNVLPLRPRAAAAAAVFADELLVADILLAVPVEAVEELATRPTAVAADDDDVPVLLDVAVPPLVVVDDDIVVCSYQNRDESRWITFRTVI